MKYFQRPYSHPSRKVKGFSLLELSIALAILAILTGGILKGRELINSAKVQAAATELASLETALGGFESRFAALPGDFSQPSPAGLGDNAGNSNGQIDTTAEIGTVFEHLSRAGLITGSFVAINGALENCPQTSCMKSSLGGTYLINNVLVGNTSESGATNIRIGSNVAPKMLAELDRKLDDGSPLSGSIQVLDTDIETCVTDTGRWDEAQGSACNALYLIR